MKSGDRVTLTHIREGNRVFSVGDSGVIVGGILVTPLGYLRMMVRFDKSKKLYTVNEEVGNYAVLESEYDSGR